MASTLDSVAEGFTRLPREIVERAAARFDELAAESAAQRVGGGGTMNLHTAKGRRPVKLRTISRITRGAVGTTALVRGKPVGNWSWLEDGTTAHDVTRRKGKSRKGGGRPRALFGPGLTHPFLGPAHHQGARGFRTWTSAVDEMDFEIDGLVDAEVREVIRGGS